MKNYGIEGPGCGDGGLTEDYSKTNTVAFFSLILGLGMTREDENIYGNGCASCETVNNESCQFGLDDEIAGYYATGDGKPSDLGWGE